MSAKVSWWQRRRMIKDAKVFLREGDFLTAAETFAEAGKLSKAQKFFLKGDAPAKAGQIALSRGKPLESARIFSEHGFFLQAAEAFKLAGDSDSVREMYRRQAARYSEERKEFLAAEMYEKAGDVERSAALYEQSGFFDRAARVLQSGAVKGNAAELLERHLATESRDMPRDEIVKNVAECARLYASEGKLDRSAAICRRFDVHQEAGKYSLAMGLWEEAVSDFKNAGDVERVSSLLREHGRDREADFFCAEIAVDEGNFLEAAALFLRQGDTWRAAGSFADGGDYAQAGRLYAIEGREEDAARCFLQADMKIEALDSFVKAGRLDEALRLAEQLGNGEIIADVSLKSGQFMKAGLAFLEQGLEREAIAAFQRIPEDDPSWFAAQEHIVSYFLQQGLPDLAEKRLREVLEGREINQQTIGLFYHDAECHIAAGRSAEAKERFAKIVQFDITYRDAMKRLKELQPPTQMH